MIAFSGLTRVITLSATSALSVRDVYSRWVDWVVASDNSKFVPAFRNVGGDVIDASAGTSVPAYVYLLNGWRIRPMESSHTLTVSGGVLLVDGGGDPFLDTLGAFTVRVNYQNPVQSIGTSGGGAGASDVADAVWAKMIEGPLSAQALLRILLAGVANPTQGAGSAVEKFFSVDGTKPRIETQIGPTGDRQVVTLDGS